MVYLNNTPEAQQIFSWYLIDNNNIIYEGDCLTGYTVVPLLISAIFLKITSKIKMVTNYVRVYYNISDT